MEVSPTPEMVSAYESKYDMSLGGVTQGIYRLSMDKALAWTESDFPKSATRWRFVRAS